MKIDRADAQMPDLLLSKVVATGNDFLFIDSRMVMSPRLPPRPELARKLCDRHFGIGADGLVFVESGKPAPRLKWDFYNSDGSAAEMCGNASRCMGRWAQRKLGLSSVEFDTTAGLVRAAVDSAVSGEKEGMIASVLDYVQITFQPLSAEVASETRQAYLVNTGVPHVVIESVDIQKAVRELAVVRAFRFHPSAGPGGANVTFLQRHSENRFSTVTFERGIENFTLSCGTGVLAAGAVGLLASGQNEAELQTPGGLLRVEYGKNWRGAVLRGPANFLFDVSISEEFFK